MNIGFPLTAALPGWERLPRPSSPRSSVKCLIGVLPGDGIGPEVTEATIEVLRAVARPCQLELEFHYSGPIGQAAERQFGRGLAPAVVRDCEVIFAAGGAVLCGPGGGRFVYDLRQHFRLYCKLVPIQPLRALGDCSVFRPEARNGVDILVVRENVGGIYFGKGTRNISPAGQRQARQSFHYSEHEVRRIVAVALQLAERRRHSICLVVKTSGIPVMSGLWVEVFRELVAERPVHHLILEVDNASYQLLAAGQAFDVVVAPNLFGDILADEAALLLGSRGLSYSGNFGAAGHAVYQTGHGAALDLAGQGIANPIGHIFTAAMMLRESFQQLEAAALIEMAVEHTLAAGIRTLDISSATSRVVGTREMGHHIASWIIEHGLRQAGTRGEQTQKPD